MFSPFGMGYFRRSPAMCPAEVKVDLLDKSEPMGGFEAQGLHFR